MSVTDIPESPPATPTTGQEPQRCDECGTAVDPEQRYCVNCGAHRRTANDPAARYFSQVTARSRAKTGVVARGREPRRSSPIVLGLALAVIPVAVGVGVAVGRSSNNNDGKLIQALNHRQAAATTVAAAPSTTVTQTSASSTPATSSHTGKHAAAKGKAAKGGHAKKAAHHKASASTGQTAAQKAGITTPVAKTKVGGSGSSAQQAQGKKIVDKLKHTTGTSYLNQLPQQVVVP
jgi:hypothetical protein